MKANEKGRINLDLLFHKKQRSFHIQTAKKDKGSKEEGVQAIS